MFFIKLIDRIIFLILLFSKKVVEYRKRRESIINNTLVEWAIDGIHDNLQSLRINLPEDVMLFITHIKFSYIQLFFKSITITQTIKIYVILT
jgi:hypothetical protein